MAQQQGIARRPPRPPLPRRRGGVSPQALRADLDALFAAIAEQQKQIDQAFDLLARRVNEMLLSGTLAERPAAGVIGRVYQATNQAPGARLTFDIGTAWQAP